MFVDCFCESITNAKAISTSFSSPERGKAWWRYDILIEGCGEKKREVEANMSKMWKWQLIHPSLYKYSGVPDLSGPY